MNITVTSAKTGGIARVPYDGYTAKLLGGTLCLPVCDSSEKVQPSGPAVLTGDDDQRKD
jgi:hypothetical protein